MTAFVIDASVLCCALLPDETTAHASTLLTAVGEQGALAPSLWLLEAANALTFAMRRGRIGRGYRDEAIANLLRLPVFSIAIEPDHIITRVVRLADAHRLTIYDASYLAVALEKGVPLATLDESLAAAAQRERVAVL